MGDLDFQQSETAANLRKDEKVLRTWKDTHFNRTCAKYVKVSLSRSRARMSSSTHTKRFPPLQCGMLDHPLPTPPSHCPQAKASDALSSRAAGPPLDPPPTHLGSGADDEAGSEAVDDAVGDGHDAAGGAGASQ